MKNIRRITYTYWHKQAVKYLYKKYKGRLSNDEKSRLEQRIRFHDSDKLFLLLNWGIKKTCHWHYYHVPHHTWMKDTKPDPISILESLFDDEAGHLTKIRKPLNAFDTLQKKSFELTEKAMPYLERLGWAESYDVKKKESFNVWKEKMDSGSIKKKAYKEIADFLNVELSEPGGVYGQKLFVQKGNGGIYTIDKHFVCTEEKLQYILNRYKK